MHEGKEDSLAAAEAWPRHGEEEMGKRRVAGFLGGLIVLLLPAMRAKAGDIVGTLAVAKPDKAVVYVEKVPGTFQSGRAKIDQKNKVFHPYVLPVLRGTTVEFLNGDDLQHNVFGVGADEFNLGAFGKGAVREHTFNKEGQVAILCNVHPEMEAYVLVLDNPYFAHGDSSGKFRIANVPPGNYVLKAWYSGKTRKQMVTVPATGTVTVAF